MVITACNALVQLQWIILLIIACVVPGMISRMQSSISPKDQHCQAKLLVHACTVRHSALNHISLT